jgi:hypothetical protein
MQARITKAQMAERIAQLEQALAQAQVRTLADVHPCEAQGRLMRAMAHAANVAKAEPTKPEPKATPANTRKASAPKAQAHDAAWYKAQPWWDAQAQAYVNKCAREHRTWTDANGVTREVTGYAKAARAAHKRFAAK